MAEKGDSLVAHAEALMDLAEVAEVAGDPSLATGSVREAIRYYELKGNVFAADRARVMLAELPA